MRAYAPTAPALLPRPARPNNRDRNPEKARQAASYAPVCGLLNTYFSRYRWSKLGQRLADSFFLENLPPVVNTKIAQKVSPLHPGGSTKEGRISAFRDLSHSFYVFIHDFAPNYWWALLFFKIITLSSPTRCVDAVPEIFS